ncbi:DNA ligase [Saccharopolyspora sp. HNM0983]|uniref:DNA ligase n=1 Tax=Saccharopolyspora montiporae TaxID=2781240 RepID=A0A929BB28_9PSEU|nr:DNA polymerase ligase N-terminal domain-containing protein [Saccharopolyspora sp. HNM0983]MBE9376594.1 DNA ligase [Saccharopolyspora sp. HNM0983]
MTDDGLATYRARRDTATSGEPSGARSGANGGPHPRFVVQRHEASSLHYDFRLEADGVLKSWAVPKGPSLDPHDKRLATQTEDHPVDYADFEGEIPEGYGAGTVVVWDTGTYRNLTEHRGAPVPVPDALDRGHVKVELRGSKLHGAFALTRTRMDGRAEWLLVKVDDAEVDRRHDPVREDPESVLSGRTNAELRSGGGR